MLFISLVLLARASWD